MAAASCNYHGRDQREKHLLLHCIYPEMTSDYDNSSEVVLDPTAEWQQRPATTMAVIREKHLLLHCICTEMTSDYGMEYHWPVAVSCQLA
ncbi:hypothetical protein WISP_109115 [Willisornis vidua]|uniref:Uncharacterized protein n=1 Tax=Willisornis vidua TaxID=1566151 RepID=A0ABQ9D126_9PASS|nr:hypothetical protein WISP_109115 [Willisornis vidua]